AKGVISPCPSGGSEGGREGRLPHVRTPSDASHGSARNLGGTAFRAKPPAVGTGREGACSIHLGRALQPLQELRSFQEVAGCPRWLAGALVERSDAPRLCAPSLWDRGLAGKGSRCGAPPLRPHMHAPELPSSY